MNNVNTAAHPNRTQSQKFLTHLTSRGMFAEFASLPLNYADLILHVREPDSPSSPALGRRSFVIINLQVQISSSLFHLTV